MPGQIKPILVFSEEGGVNNVSEPYRLGVNWETGNSELIDACNVVFNTVSGNISRRKGWTVKIPFTNARNLFVGANFAVFTVGVNLYLLTENYTYSALITALAVDVNGISLPLVYGVVAGRLYFTNGTNSHFIDYAGVLKTWALPSTYYGPVSQRAWSGPPASITKIFPFKGRLCCVVGKVIYYSERLDYGRFDLANNYWNFPSAVLDAGVVGNNVVYAGTNIAVYSFIGDDATTVARKEVVSDTMLAGSFKDNEIKGEHNELIAVGAWLGNNGVYIADDTGVVINIAANRFKFDVSTVVWSSAVGDEYWCKFAETHREVKGIYVNLSRKTCAFFTGLDFTAVCGYKSTVFGLNGFGISSVFGADDSSDNEETIDAYFELPQTDLNTYGSKRVRKVKLGFYSDGPLTLTTITAGGKKTQYIIPELDTDTFIRNFCLRLMRVKPSKYIGFRFANSDGCYLVINSLTALVLEVPDRYCE